MVFWGKKVELSTEAKQFYQKLECKAHCEEDVAQLEVSGEWFVR